MQACHGPSPIPKRLLGVYFGCSPCCYRCIRTHLRSVASAVSGVLKDSDSTMYFPSLDTAQSGGVGSPAGSSPRHGAISQGFRVGFQASSKLRSTQHNFKSAQLHSEVIQSYLESELALRQVLGPFTEQQLPGNK